MKKYKQLPVISAMTSFFIITILGIHYFFPVLENASYDLSLSLIKKRPPDSIVIIGLDPRSVSEFGTLPWPRILTADLIRKIQSCNPRVIAMDFLFPKRPDDPGTDSLVALFSTIPHLVTGMRVDNVMEGQETSIALVTPEAYKHRFLMLKQPEKLPQSVGYAAGKLDFGDPYLSQYATRAGFLNVATSRTSQKLREIIHVIRAGKEYYPSFGLAAAAEFCGVKPDKLILDGNGRILLNDKKILFTRGTGSVYINYRGKPGTFPTVSAADVLAGTVDPALLKNKLVFVGITDALSSPTDFFLTPEGPQFPGVEIWATATADILENSWIRRGGLVPALNLIILFCIFPGVIALFPLKKKKYAIAAGTGIVALSLVGSIVILQTTGHYWNAGVHFYAWAFMILWYATRKTDLIVVREKPMLLEPVFTEEKLHPPAGQDFIRNIPQTDTAGFVMNFIAPGKNGTPDIFKDSNKTMVDAEVNIAKEGDLRNDKPDAFLEKFSQLANGRMIRHLGSGGMADVYLVWHPRMEVYRAIKVIKPGQPTQWVQRFETELRIFANLNHPNIVQCYGVGEWYTLPYIEMEYVQGVSMEQVMKSDVGLTPVDVACIGILVCRALYYAHNEVVNLYGESYKGIIHRDLKPANILLSRSGHIKLTDFGIARPGAVSLHTSEAGKVVGTLPYLAPEQFKGEIITAKTDIYALGTTLFELATGKRGFPQQDIPTLITAKTRDCFKLQDRAPELPQPFAQIIERAMALDPADRFPSALQMGQCLELFLRSAFQNKETFILSGLVNRIFKPT